jgi:hypothetical protein
MNKPSSSPRRRRGKFPELIQITNAIDHARTLRLTVSALANYQLLAEPAREAVTACRELSVKLEVIADLVAGAKTRSRKRRPPFPETSPPEPSLGLEDTTGGQT